MWDSALPKNNFNDLLPSDVVDGKGEGEGADKKDKLILPTNSAPGLSDSQCSTYPNNTYTAGQYGYVCPGHITGANFSKLAYSI